MAEGKLSIIATSEIQTDILAVEDVPTLRDLDEHYLSGLRKLVKDKRAQFAGRAISDEGGMVYQIFKLPEDGDEPARTVFVEDRPATKVVSTLLDSEGNVRRIRIKAEDKIWP